MNGEWTAAKLAFLIVFVASAEPTWAHGTTDRVSVASGGAQANLESFQAALSADGRFVAFSSFASNLVRNDTNATADIFLRDRGEGSTTRLSVGHGGTQANGASGNPAVSPDGRFVAFSSNASNLVPADTNELSDVFLLDRRTGTIQRVSLGQGHAQGNGFDPSISADGRFVAFNAFANLLPGGQATFDVFVRDRQTSTTHRVSVGSGNVSGNADSLDPTISADGRFVAFQSLASNLVPGDTNCHYDVFVRDLKAGTTRRMSVGPKGQGDGESAFPAISAEGRFVAFSSLATNLVDGDTNATTDVFIRDRWTGATRRVSVGVGSVQGNGASASPALSASGRVVAFSSAASNLVSGDTNGVSDVYLRHLQTGAIRRVSVGAGGTQGNGFSGSPALTAHGRVIAFELFSTTLVPGDTNNVQDVFVRVPRP